MSEEVRYEQEPSLICTELVSNDVRSKSFPYQESNLECNLGPLLWGMRELYRSDADWSDVLYILAGMLSHLSCDHRRGLNQSEIVRRD